MEKRVILAFVLSIAVMYAFTALYTSRKPAEPAAAVETASPPATPAAANQSPATPSGAAEKAEPALPAGQESRADKAEDFVIDTPLYTATVTNVGGLLKSYRLKEYSDGEGQPLELIDQMSAAKVGWPLTLMTGDNALDNEVNTAQMVGHRDADRLSLDFVSKGLLVRKIFQFDRGKYEFSLQSIVMKDGKSVPFSIAWRGGFGDQSISQDPVRKNAVYQTDSSFKRVNLRSLKDQEQSYTTVRAGVDDQYFLAMFLLPDNPVQAKIRKLEYPAPDGKSQMATLSVAVAVPGGRPVPVYVGPKQREALSKTDPQLPSVVDYGYFEFIARPLVFCLLWIHSYIGNFGWAIILLTIALNVVLFPLRLKQQVSMLKMQKIQPQMRRLQDQYKKLKATDPRRAQVQADMMNLYKEHGVNPMGGCLPLLLQMPLLFGFYSALSYSIELRRAPWMLWVKDLSQPDYVIHNIPILALVMAVSMFIQQRLTPTTNVDPAQAKMMMIMPVMFTFMFWSQSSGLVLYWLTSNVIGIIQQIFINKYWSPHAEAKLGARAKPKEAREN
jgi:YidC/Oxa1 family membrane protein insertase